MTVNAALAPPQALLTQILETTYGVTPSTGAARGCRFLPPLTPGGVDAMSSVLEVGNVQTSLRDTTMIAPDLITPTLALGAMLSISEIDWLLSMAFGDPNSAAGTAGDSGHTIDTYTSGFAIRSRTLQSAIGNVTRVYAGVAVDTLTVPLAKEGGYRQITAACVCRRPAETSVSSGWTVTAPPAPIYIPGWATSLSINGVAFPITAGTMTYSNGIERPTQTDGSREPSLAYGGVSSLEMSLSALLINQAQVAAFNGALAASASINIEMRPTAGSAPRVAWAVPTALISKPEISIVEGQQQINLSVMARQTTSLPMLTCTVVRPTA
jgi:hypothetical protein